LISAACHMLSRSSPQPPLHAPIDITGSAGSDSSSDSSSASASTQPSPLQSDGSRAIAGRTGSGRAGGSEAGASDSVEKVKQPGLFELLSSVVVDEATGETLEATKIVRGTCRLETVTFRAGGKLVNLRRRNMTLKSFGLMWKAVGDDTIDLGSYEAQAEPFHFDLPKQVVPSTVLAKGAYRVQITYSAANVATPLYEQEVTFKII